MPGAGLLLLRASAGVGLVVQGSAYFLDWHNQATVMLVVAFSTIASGLLLLIGYLTPLAAGLAMLIDVGCVLSWIPTPAPDLFAGRSTVALATVIATALVCLGPGAFSLDSRLFGRREIIIPDSSSLPKQ